MDPASAIGLAGAVAGLVDVVAKTVLSLVDLQKQYQEADFKLGCLICQLVTLKASLNRIADIVGGCDGHEPPRNAQFSEDLRISMYGCEAMVGALNTRIASLRRTESNGLSVSSKIDMVLDDSTINDYLAMLNNQTNALHLLLTTLQCQTSLAIDQKLQETSSRQIIDRVRDDASSLLSLYDAGSLVSTRSRELRDISSDPVSFSFDPEIFTSRVYQTAMRYQMRVSGNKDGEGPTESDTASSRLGINRRFSFSVHSEKAFDIDDSASVHSLSESANHNLLSATNNGGDIQPADGTPAVNSCSGTAKFLQKDLSSNVLLEVPSHAKNVLLIGSSESGKSTLIKSLECAHGLFTTQTRQTYIEEIIQNCVETMRLLVIETDMDRAGGGHSSLHLQEECRVLLEDENGRMGSHKMHARLASAISTIWEDPHMKSRFERRRQHQEMYYLPTSSEYFLKSVNRLAQPTYLPTDSDILRSYCKTSGVCISDFTSAGRSYNFYDVGGARSQRRKWIELFPKANVFMWTFDVACAGEVSQDHGGDSMEEQLELWEFVANHHRIDANATFVVMFTKIDKLTEAVLSRLLTVKLFQGYEGDVGNLDKILDHIAGKLASAVKGSSINVAFCSASIARSPTEMARVAMSALRGV